MFFKQIKRNVRRSRKENGLYFGSLIITIVASYVLLSLGQQDVITFLRTLESDAVGRLLMMIPVVYIISLFFMFFLVYFSNSYQLQRRSHEFGMYQILGMKRKRLFSMLMGETLWNSLIALAIGIPIALFLTELISLATVKLIGMEIVGHQFHISWPGLLGTVAGFLVVQLAAMILLSIRMSRKEPIELLNEDQEVSQKVDPKKTGWNRFFLGLALLLVAYSLGVFLFNTLGLLVLWLIIITGITGTFFVFQSLSTFIGRWIQKRNKRSTGLFTFTGRQLQENVLHQSSFLAIASLLVLMAIVSLSYGISSSLGDGRYAERTVDISLQGDQEAIEQAVASKEISPYIYAAYPMNLSNFKSTIYDNNGGIVGEGIDFSWDGFLTALETTPGISDRDPLVQRFTYDQPFLVSISSFNDLLASTGKQQVSLEPGEVIFYSSGQFGANNAEFETILQSHPQIRLDGKAYTLAPELQSLNLVADRFISVMYALIVPDDVYQDLVGYEEPFCWNVTLDPDYVEERGLMQALLNVNSLFATTGLSYESYLSGIGRQLFYVVAGSYLTIYLGVLFLIIANTVLGIKFLMQQRSTQHRYETLLILGANEDALYASAKTQIRIYFALVIGVAVFSSIFGIATVNTSLMSFRAAENMGKIMTIAGAAVLAFLLIELAYVGLIQSTSKREIHRLNSLD
jgi:putative ABC transport system permease protein